MELDAVFAESARGDVHDACVVDNDVDCGCVCPAEDFRGSGAY